MKFLWDNPIRQIAGGVILLATMLSQAEARTLSLAEYIQVALQNNHEVQEASLAVTAASHARESAFTGYFPKVSAYSVMLNNNIIPAKSMNVPGFEILDEAYTFGLSGLTVEQPLFAGGRIVNGHRLAKIGENAAKEQLRQKTNEVLITAEKKYRTKLVLGEKRKTLRAYADMMDALYRQTEQAVSRGIATKTDLLRVRLKKAEIADSEIDLDKSIGLAKKELLLFAGVPQNEEFEVMEDSQAVTAPEVRTDDLKARVLLRPEYQLLKMEAESARLYTNLKTGEFLPSIAIGAELDRLDNLSQGGHSQSSMGFAVLRIPISGWWGGSHEIEEYKKKEESARKKFTALSDYLQLDLEEKLKDFEQAYSRVMVARIGVEEGDANKVEIENGYQHGIEKLSDLLEAMALQQQSQDRLSEATATYFVARSAFYATASMLVGH